MSANIDRAIENYRSFLETIEERLDGVEVGTAIPATVVSKELCGKYGVDWTQLYHGLLFFASINSDAYEIKRGPKGGIARKVKKEVVVEGEQQQ